MPDDPDATPAENLAAYLAENEPEPLPARIPWRERWRAGAEVFLAIGAVIAVMAGLVWISAKP